MELKHKFHNFFVSSSLAPPELNVSFQIHFFQKLPDFNFEIGWRGVKIVKFVNFCCVQIFFFSSIVDPKWLTSKLIINSTKLKM